MFLNPYQAKVPGDFVVFLIFLDIVMNSWMHLDEKVCLCHGSGWAESAPELWEECLVHFEGQLHPQTRVLMLDEPSKLLEEERKSILQFKIISSHEYISELQKKIRYEQERLVNLQLELVNKTPTIRMLVTIPPNDPMLNDHEITFIAEK